VAALACGIDSHLFQKEQCQMSEEGYVCRVFMNLQLGKVRYLCNCVFFCLYYKELPLDLWIYGKVDKMRPNGYLVYLGIAAL
jgi:hypothetical protein